MQTRRVALLAAMLLVACTSSAWAMHEWEVWRSPFGSGLGPVVNPTDGSVWFSQGDTVYHYRADHALLSKTELWLPMTLCVNAQDGSCWVADWGPNVESGNESALVHLGSDGREVGRVLGLRRPVLTTTAAPDGSVWLMDRGSTLFKLIRRSASGDVLAQYGPLNVAGMAVDPADGTCWALDCYSFNQRLLHLAVDGSILWSGPFALPPDPNSSPYRLACDAADGSVWVADVAASEVAHVSVAGVELSRTYLAEGVWTVSWDPQDHTCWVRTASETLVHVGTDGSVLGSLPCRGALLDPTTGTFWSAAWWRGFPATALVQHFGPDGTVLWETGESFVGAYADSRSGASWTWSSAGDLLRVNGHGQELWRRPPFGDPYGSPAVAVNVADGSLYLVFELQATLVRVAPEGSEQVVPLSYTPGTAGGLSDQGLAVNPADGSFWATLATEWDPEARRYRPLTFHLAADGSELGRIVGPPGAGPARVLAVDAADGSLWAYCGSGPGTSEIAHFTEDGAKLWSTDATTWSVYGMCVDPKDGSCWTAGDQVRHFAQDGTLLLHLPEAAEDVAVDPVTQDCWVAGYDHVSVFAPDGTRLWTADGFARTARLDAVALGGSVWVDSALHGQLVHLWAPTTPFYDVLPGHWAGRAIRMCYEYGIVGGYPDGYYHPEWGVSRAQMAGFISRALAEGDANVPPGPETPHFPDVGADYWAYKYIEYAYANNIVAGYPDGQYGPEVPVDRGQMAAFIARGIVTPTGEAGLAGYTPPETPSFPDVPTDFWTYKHIEYIKGQGIVGGYPDGRYHPAELCSRDQMAVFIARAFDLLPY